MEEWRDIAGYEEEYEVSNCGRVRSLNYMRTKQAKELTPVKDGMGYLFVNLYKNGKNRGFKIHRLVAQAFIPNPENKPQVNHIDEDKTNNCAENLEWCTAKENMNHGTRTKRAIKTLQVNGKTSYPVLGINIATGEILKYPSTKEAGRNGFSQSCVAECLRGERAKHKGYLWIADNADVEIKGEVISLNPYIQKERSNRYAAAAIKKQETERCEQAAKEAIEKGVKVKCPCRLKIVWCMKNKRIDYDNYRFYIKFMLDGFVKAGLIEDDSQKYIRGAEEYIAIDKENPRVLIWFEAV
ncbi:NUMOD4 motif-containing HNH endonuclease [Enterococcus faecium]|nr:NUMOD4 motif-containing HNH endonuclease [Enterococcus faecium]